MISNAVEYVFEKLTKECKRLGIRSHQIEFLCKSPGLNLDIKNTNGINAKKIKYLQMKLENMLQLAKLEIIVKEKFPKEKKSDFPSWVQYGKAKGYASKYEAKNKLFRAVKNLQKELDFLGVEIDFKKK